MHHNQLLTSKTQLQMKKDLEAVTPEGEVVGTNLQASPITMQKQDIQKIETSLSKLEEAEAGIDMDGKYLEFSKGQKVRGVFLGFKTLKKKEGDSVSDLLAAFWMDSSKSIWCNAGAVLVNKMAQYATYSMLEIEFLGQVKTSNGHKVNDFAVRPLLID